jgi:hypothetical protein
MTGLRDPLYDLNLRSEWSVVNHRGLRGGHRGLKVSSEFKL